MYESNLKTEKKYSYINKSLHLVILPTEQCNFRCFYCYENYQNGKMSLETINGLKKFLENRAQDLDLLILEWFGGEPLVATDIVLDISNFALELSNKYHFELTSKITTNGYNLTSEIFLKLYKVNIKTYQITFDGPREIHDKTRVLINGEGSFDKIWNNLINIQNSKKDIIILLRIHLDEDKISYIENLIKDINQQFKGDSRFRILFKPISKLGGRNDNLLKVLLRERIDSYVNILNSKVSSEHTLCKNDSIKDYCFASYPNSLVIRSTGEICKCSLGLNDSRNFIGNLNSDGTMSINNEKLQPWFAGIINNDDAILKCPYKHIKLKN